MRYRILCAGLLASIAAGAGAAAAADYAVRPAPPPPAPVPVPVPYISEWTGFYVGIHGGGGWGHKEFDPAAFVIGNPQLAFTPPDLSPHGGVFGFQFGHNWQWGPVVGGVEIDFSGADIHEGQTVLFPVNINTFTADTKIDELASARFRLGYLIFPNWLLYGTAGIGWGHEELTTTAVSPIFGPLLAFRSFNNEFGWVAGGGVEWKFADHWLLRGEWLHYDFARVNNIAVAPAGIFGAQVNLIETKATVDVARAALSYKF